MTSPRLPPPRKRFGQHFLSDPRILARIAGALELTGSERVVEIGAGRGALTEVLAPLVRHLTTIEIDRALAARLREQYAGSQRVTVLEGDVLETDLAEAAGGPPFLVVGNVPYYITTPILFHALAVPRPARAVYLVQREVAERIVAPPGAGAYGALSANVQAVADAELLFRVAPGAFSPPPKVESAVIRLTPRAEPAIVPSEEGAYRRLVVDAFGLRRKQMRRVVRTLFAYGAADAERVLQGAGVDVDARPETLSPEAFARLLRALPVSRD